MNAQVNLAIMEELVRIHHKDIAVSVHLVLRVFNVMRKIVTVIKFHHLVQSAQCAEMSQELVILAAFAEPDIKARNVTLLLILVSQILAATEPNANSYNKEDFSAIVKKDGRDLCVTSILMTVQSNHVLSEQIAQISSMTTGVNVQLVLLGSDVKTRSIYACPRDA